MKGWKAGALSAALAIVLATAAGCTHNGSMNSAAAGGAGQATAVTGTGNQTGAPQNDTDQGNASDSSGKSKTSGQAAGAEGASGKNTGTANGNSSGKASDAGSTIKSGASPDAPPQNVRMGQVTAMRLIDADSGWVGGKGWIARTDDAGKKWTIQYLGNGDQRVSQIFALNGQQAWCVFTKDGSPDSADRLLMTLDGGKHWQPIGRMPNRSFLHFVSASEGFAGNEHTTDGGRTWQKLPIPAGTVGDPYFHDAKDGWAVTNGSKKFMIRRTADGGKTWKTVMSRDTMEQVSKAVIRSAGKSNAWVELYGDSGMSQTAYSLFQTSDGGENWTAVMHSESAGAGPGPGFKMGDSGQKSLGAAPGPLDVVSPKVAFVGGYCAPCDKSNSIGWTTDGGKTFTAGKAVYPGYAGAFIMMADSKKGWWLCADASNPSVLYTTADGGLTWQKAHTFDKPSKGK